MKPTITIVDDDMRNCFALSCILEDAGFECESFTDGSDFLDRYASRHGCVLLDIYMPGIDGVEVLRQMRRRGWRTPVVVFTYSDYDLAGRRAEEEGALRCLVRPVNCDHLVATVKNALVIDAWERREQAWRLRTLAR